MTQAVKFTCITGIRQAVFSNATGIWSNDPTLFAFSDLVGKPYMFRITDEQGAIRVRTDLHSLEQIGQGATNPGGGVVLHGEDFTYSLLIRRRRAACRRRRLLWAHPRGAMFRPRRCRDPRQTVLCFDRENFPGMLRKPRSARCPRPWPESRRGRPAPHPRGADPSGEHPGPRSFSGLRRRLCRPPRLRGPPAGVRPHPRRRKAGRRKIRHPRLAGKADVSLRQPSIN